MRSFLILQISLIWMSFSTNDAFGQSVNSNIEFPAFDTLFKTATNSPDYVVASKNQVNVLKEYLEKERIDRLKIIELQKKEISQLQNSMDSVVRISNLKQPEPIIKNSDGFSVIFLAIILFLLIGLIISFLKVSRARKNFRDIQDTYSNLLMEFDLHKKNAIERERKLMRKVIDLQNKLDIKSNPEG